MSNQHFEVCGGGEEGESKTERGRGGYKKMKRNAVRGHKSHKLYRQLPKAGEENQTKPLQRKHTHSETKTFIHLYMQSPPHLSSPLLHCPGYVLLYIIVFASVNRGGDGRPPKEIRGRLRQQRHMEPMGGQKQRQGSDDSRLHWHFASVLL